MTGAPRPTAKPPREMTQEQALAMLRRYSRVQWVATIVAWSVAGLIMILIRRLLFEDPWSSAVSYGAYFGLVLMVVFLAMDWRRAHRLPDTSGWDRLEEATVMAREGPSVTLRGKRGARRTVTALVRQSHLLREGDPVWVGPALTAGERLVLVRSTAGPFGTPVLSSFEPASAGTVQ